MPRNRIKRLRLVSQYVLLYVQNNAEERLLHVKGDIAIKVGNNNYKVIDLYENSIFTTFDEGDEENIYKNLVFQNSSSMHERIFYIDKKNRIVKGEFYNAHHPKLDKLGSKQLQEALIHLFANLVTGSAIKRTEGKRYADSLANESLSILKRNAHRITDEEFTLTEKFILEKHKSVTKKYHNKSIPLTLSHGDIKQDNLLEGEIGLVLIDWEFADFRSPAYDLLKFKSRFPLLEKDFHYNLYRRLSEELECNEENHKDLVDYFQSDEEEKSELFQLEDIKLRLKQFETRSFAKHFSKTKKYIARIEKAIIS